MTDDNKEAPDTRTDSEKKADALFYAAARRAIKDSVDEANAAKETARTEEAQRKLAEGPQNILDKILGPVFGDLFRD